MPEFNDEAKTNELRIKKWDHIPVRPETFAEFRRLKNTRSDDAFILTLLKSYKTSTFNTTGVAE